MRLNEVRGGGMLTQPKNKRVKWGTYLSHHRFTLMIEKIKSMKRCMGIRTTREKGN